MKLRPYQDEAADFLFANDRAMVLAPVGAGKTAITLTAMDAMWRQGVMGNGRWLVIAPLRVARFVWPVEMQKWSKHMRCAIAIGSERDRLRALDAPAKTGANVVVINYDNLQWLTKVLDKLNGDLVDAGFTGVVFDELTRLKNPSGARYKSLEKIIKRVPVRWGLTGSFTSNGLEDVFGQCKIVDQALLGRSKGAFLQQYFYCRNREFSDYVPLPGSLEAVMERIRPATFVLEPGVYRDRLPDLHTVPVTLEMEMDVYKEMKKQMVLTFDDDAAVAANAAVLTTKLQQIASGFVYGAATQWLSSHKLDALDDIFNENQRAPTLIWYQYQAELIALKARYPKLEELTNEHSIDRWNAGQIEMLAVHPKSAGHGINLQGQNLMVWMSLPWSLELYEQAVGRLHRGGQTRDVWNYVLLTKGTVDEVIWKALHDKRSVSEIALEALK